MALKYDDKGNPIYMLNGVRIVETKDGLLIGTGIDQVLIRGQNLKVSDAASWIAGHYPDNYPFSAPHRHPQEDEYRNFALDANFPPDGIPLDRLPKVIRELKKMVAGTSSVQTTFPASVQDGDLVVWDPVSKTYKPATCPRTRADLAAGLFFNGVADLETNSVITSSTVTSKAWNLQTGQKYFLDCSRPGKLTTTDTGYFVGIAQGPQTLFIAPLANSAEDLITALETAQAALQNAHNQLKNAFEAYKNGGVRKPGGGIGIDPTTKGLYVVCDEIESCINEKVKKLFSTPPSGSTNPGGSSQPSDIIQNIINNISQNVVKPGGGLQFDADGKLSIKCADIKKCVEDTVWGDSGGSSNPQPPTNSAICKAVSACLKNIIDPSRSGLYFDTDGTLCVSLQELDPDELAAILSSMIIPNGGIVIEETTVNGKKKYGLKVNFDSMGPDAFNELKASLKLPIQLTKNMAIYVNSASSNASDVTEETVTDSFGQTSKRFLTTKGQSVNDPFATISAALRYVTENFNLSTYYCYIYIHTEGNENAVHGVYEENLTLPAYQTSGGAIYLYPWNGSTANTPDTANYFRVRSRSVTNALARNSVAHISGGSYAIFGAHFICAPNSITTSRIGYCPVVYVSGGSASLNGCYLDLDYTNIQLLQENNGVRDIMNGYLLYITANGNASIGAWKTQMKFEMMGITQTYNKLHGIYCAGSGTIARSYKSDALNNAASLGLTNGWNTFIIAGTGGRFTGAGTGNDLEEYPTIANVADPASLGGNGRPYQVQGGASITCPAGVTYFPAKTGVSGTVDSANFGFYAT